MDEAQIIDFAAEMRNREPRPADEDQSKAEVTKIVRLRTEMLRKLLDEHGIHHRDPFPSITEFSIRALPWHTTEVGGGLALQCNLWLTPQQVVEFIERLERA